MKNNILKVISIVIGLIYVLIPSSSFASAPPEVFADSAILIDADSGQTLYDKDSHKKMYPASTTKILTCIIAIEETKPDELATVDDATPFEVEGGHIALEPGEVLSMDQLLNALMLNSANDAGMVIARHISGSIEDFADLMNKRAKEMGALNSNFRNPHGLPDKEHVTTAYDLSMIAKYAMKNDKFRYYVSKVEDTIPQTNKKEESRYLINSNKMLYSDMDVDVDGTIVPAKYDGITGIKTGYTDDAWQCLVSSAKRNDKEFISVVLKTNDNGIYADSHKLLNYAFNSFEPEVIASKNDKIKAKLNGKNINTYIKKDIVYDNKVNDNKKEITNSIEPLPSFSDDYKSGDSIAKISYFADGEEFTSADLYAESDSLKGKIQNISKTNINDSPYLMIFAVIIVLFLILIVILGLRKKFIKNIQSKKRIK